MSAVYSKLNKKSIETAINKAKTVKPLVRVNGYNNFTVTGSKAEKYTVCFTGSNLDFTGECTCKANQGNKVCYHIAAVATIYKGQVAQRAAERAATALALCSDCRLDTATSKEGRCQDCQLVKDNEDIF